MLTGQGFCAVVSAASLGAGRPAAGVGQVDGSLPGFGGRVGPKPAEAKDAAVGDWPVFE